MYSIPFVVITPFIGNTFTYIALKLYLIHWPVAFPKTDDDALFPLTTQRSNEVVIDRGVSLVDTWKGKVAYEHSYLISR